MKTLKSFEELECLLTEEQRNDYRNWKFCKNVLAQRPSYMRTEQRVLPFLPSWMVKKVLEIRELYNCNNTIYGERLLWNHLLRLFLGEDHEVTFAILDDKYCQENMENVMKKVVEVYKKLQRLYREYGHQLTVVSLQTDDFGMLLPPSFYDTTLENNCEILWYKEQSSSISNIIKRISRKATSPQVVDIKEIEKEYAATHSGEDAEDLANWFKGQLKHYDEYEKKVVDILEAVDDWYYMTRMWKGFDIFMDEYRKWGREFCYKLKLDENLEHLKDLTRVRPLIDDIIKITETEDFAFGIKKIGTDVKISLRVSQCH